MPSRRYLESSSFKMALLFTVLLSVSAVILGYFLIDFSRRDFLRETEAAIDIEISMLTRLARDPAGLTAYIEAREEDEPAVRFRYESEDGAWRAGGIDPLPQAVHKISEGILGFDDATAPDARAFAAKIHTLADGSRVMVARDVDVLIDSYERLQYLSVLIMLLMAAVVIVSFGISYFVVSRINRIAATAEAIVATGDLSRRLPIDSRWDDLSNLSAVLNGFLDKIEELINGVREVSNNIAHDLRTPLSGLRGDIEALKGRPVDDQQVDALLADADRILAIFHALLRIATIEKGKSRQFLRAVDLALVLADVAELYEPVAEEKNIRLVLQTGDGVQVRGDRDMLFQVFANLLDNAIKFSPAGSVIQLTAGGTENGVEATVADQGPGIEAHEKENVFKHFYRCDASRHMAGNWLGLSLVRAVAAHHQAAIALENAHPGLCVRLMFPPYQ